jgi:hypothetical protein
VLDNDGRHRRRNLGVGVLVVCCGAAVLVDDST